jgi:hypothetical protein
MQCNALITSALGSSFEDQYRIATGDWGARTDVRATQTCPEAWACGAACPHVHESVAARQYGGNEPMR